jgi:fumarate hydratase, class II
MTDMRKETDSLGVVEVPADKLWGAQTQRSLEHFSIGKDLIPCETHKQHSPEDDK